MDRTERARVLGGALKQKKNLSLRQTNFIIDPFQASLGCLLVVSFPKSNSKYYAFALSMAEGAERYGVATIGGKPMHVAVFGMTQADVGRASALIGYTRGWKGAFIFVGGKIVHDSYRLEEVLKCYLQSCQCRDTKAHCHFVIDDPFESESGSQFFNPGGDKYIFPCKHLVTWFRFQNNHPSSIEDQIQAAGVEFGCNLCPNFAPNDFRKVEGESTRHRPARNVGSNQG
jgi:hypothetical protein